MPRDRNSEPDSFQKNPRVLRPSTRRATPAKTDVDRSGDLSPDKPRRDPYRPVDVRHIASPALAAGTQAVAKMLHRDEQKRKAKRRP